MFGVMHSVRHRREGTTMVYLSEGRRRMNAACPPYVTPPRDDNGHLFPLQPIIP